MIRRCSFASPIPTGGTPLCGCAPTCRCRTAGVRTPATTANGGSSSLRRPWRGSSIELEVVHPGGDTERLCDPGNPHRAPGAFGEKSVLLLPGYAAPRWLEEEGVPGTHG